MLKLNLTYTKPQVSINGLVFDVLRSDTAIIQDMLELDARYPDSDVTGNPKLMMERNKYLMDYLEKLLGKGSLKKILGTLEGCEDLGTRGIETLLVPLVQAATAAYAEAFSAKYDDD